MNPSPTVFDKIQGYGRDCLAANSFFSGLPMFIEQDPNASADELAAREAEFEAALQAKGMALVVLAPYFQRTGGVDYEGITGNIVMPVAVCEDVQVNRRPAAGDFKPFGQKPLCVLEKVMRTLMPARFLFENIPFGRPEYGGGLLTYYLLAMKRHSLTAIAPEASP